MTDKLNRKTILFAITALLGVLVLADRFTQSDSTEGLGLTPRQAYINQFSLTNRTEQLVAQMPQWQDRLSQAQQAWQAAAARMIPAPSPELASARLRDMVQQVMTDLGVRLDASSALPVVTPVQNQPVRVIGLSLNFSAANPQEIYLLVDRLENLPDVMAFLPRISVRGPGRGLNHRLNVSMQIRAMSVIKPG